MTSNGQPQKTLGELTTLISSGSTPRGGQSVYLDDGPVMFVRSQNVRMNRLDLSDVAYITNEIDSQMQRSVVSHNDVLLNITGASIGRVARFDLKAARANVNQHVCIIRKKADELSPRYLEYFLSSPSTQHDINNRHQHGGTRQALTFAQISKFKIPLPPLSEQKRIADILDKADAIRRKRREAIAEFGGLAAAIFSEMFSHKLLNTSWSNLSDYLIELRYGTSHKSGESGYVTLRIPNIVRSIIDLSDLKTVEVSQAEFEKLLLIEGDVLFVRTNGNPDYVGRSAVFDPRQMKDVGLRADEIIYASYLIRARLQLDRLRPVFLQSLLQTAAGRKNVREKCRTSAGQYNINTKGIGALQIPDIAIEEQVEFESRVNSLQPGLAELATAQTESQNLFSSLVQRAFKGEL